MSDAIYFPETEIFPRDLRHAFDPLDEGIYGDDSFEVTAGGTGLSVDVNDGVAFVRGDADPDQGLYRVFMDTPANSESFASGGLDPAHATLPRIDRIILRVYDDEEDGSGNTGWFLEVLTGTPTAGATLVNENGAQAVPDSAVLLAVVLIPATATSVLSANIEDHRISALAFFTTSDALPTRVELDFDSGSLANGEEEDAISLGLTTGARAIKFEADAECRFRLYMSSADRAADAARPIGTDPTGDHGLIMEIVTTAGELSFRLSPQVSFSAFANPTYPYGNTFYVAIQNLSGGTTTINCILTYVQTERS